MMISTKGRYALRVMIELASRNHEKYITLKELAKAQDISEKYLESIIILLAKGGMVISLRGKRGGYKLAKAPADYTVGSILKLAEGSLAPVACLECQPIACTRAENCPTLPMWQELNTLIDNYLEGVTLSDLIHQTDDIKPSVP